MKKITAILFLTTFSVVGYSQVIIGDEIGTAASDEKTAVLLEFANDGNKGIILPYVTTLPSSPTPGTILLDASTAADARVKYYNGSWVDLSGDGAVITKAGDPYNTSDIMTGVLADQPTEVETGISVIGSTTPTADGVLVLESDTKAMILPIVESIDDVPGPSPGMMVYINKTDAKRLAVFNGSKWTFWKP